MTSTRQIGNRGENEFCAIAEALGYATFCARGSRGPVDVLCFQAVISPLPSLCVQVGTTNKPIAATLAELATAPRPFGSLCIVARRHRAVNRRVSWTYHTTKGKYDALATAIDERFKLA